MVKKSLIICTTLILIFSLISCSKNDSRAQSRYSSAAGYSSTSGGNVSYDTVLKEDFSTVRKGMTVVINTKEGWKKLWNRIYQGNARIPELPVIDHRGYTIIAVFAGKRPEGTKIKIESINNENERILVTVKIIGPGGDGDAVQPFQIVKIRKTSLQIDFKLN